jgi:hypothetical protein
MDAAAAAAAPRKRDVERLLRQPGAELRVGELRATRFETRFEPLLRSVVRCPGSFSFLRGTV